MRLRFQNAAQVMGTVALAAGLLHMAPAIAHSSPKANQHRTARTKLSRKPQNAVVRAKTGDRGRDQDVTLPDSLLIQHGGPILNLKHPPEGMGIRAAKGDGVTDDTEAFRDVYDFLKREFKKNGAFSPISWYVYLPNGTYKVSDTLIYRGPSVGDAVRWQGNFDVNHIKFIGQSRAKTIIRLADNCAGYQDAAKPKIVMAFQHPTTLFNNVPGSNWLRNVTINTGRGNPGAVALFFQGANNTDLRSVTIRSEDGAGKIGLWFKIGSIQGYYADVTVDGFDVGIRDDVNAEGDVAFEYLTLRNQREAGILLRGGGLSLRKWRSDEVIHVPALRVESAGAQAVIIDSELNGWYKGVGLDNGPEAKAAMELTANERQCLLARNVQTTGYRAAIWQNDKVAVTGPRVGEYVNSSTTTLFPDTPKRSLNLPIEDTPPVAWYDPKTQWAIVDDYPSVQAAFDSGKPVVVFKKRQYKLSGDVTVPASVKVVNVLSAQIEGGSLVVNAPSRDPLLVADSGVPIRVEAQRNVIQRCAGGGISNPNGLPVTFYLENVNDNATGDNFCRPGQKIFARQIDIEYGQGQQIVSNGGALWIFGYKTENAGATPFTVKNGGFLEILGGYTNVTNVQPPDKVNPLIRNYNGSVSATLFTNLGGPWSRTIVETRGDVTRTATNEPFPLRGGYAADYVIPLYVGYTKARSVAPSVGSDSAGRSRTARPQPEPKRASLLVQ